MLKKRILSQYINSEILRYLIVGCMTTVVSLVSYYMCVITYFTPEDPTLLQAANIISWFAAVTFAYCANRRYVFRSTQKDIIMEGMSFYLSRLGTLVVDMFIMYAGVTLLGFNDKVIKFIVQFIVTALNYILGKIFIFTGRNHRP